MNPLADLGVIDIAEYEPWSVCHVQFRIQVKQGHLLTEHRSFVGPRDAKVAEDQWGRWKPIPEAHDPAS